MTFNVFGGTLNPTVLLQQGEWWSSHVEPEGQYRSITESVQRQTYGHLPSCRASPSFGR